MPNQKKHKKKLPPRKKLPRIAPQKISLLLISIGIILLIIPVIFRLNQTIQLSFFTPVVKPQKESHVPRPRRIVISSVKLSLPIKETTISGNTWEVATNAISYLGISARPTEKGAIILYSHNTDDRFGPIRWLKNGDRIDIMTSDSNMHSYIVKNSTEVSPNAVSIFDQKDETLILYTCSGFADTKRYIVIAKPLTTQLQAF